MWLISDMWHVIFLRMSLEPCIAKNIKLMVDLLQNQCSSHCAIQYLHVHAYTCSGGQVDRNPTEMRFMQSTILSIVMAHSRLVSPHANNDFTWLSLFYFTEHLKTWSNTIIDTSCWNSLEFIKLLCSFLLITKWFRSKAKWHFPYGLSRKIF